MPETFYGIVFKFLTESIGIRAQSAEVYLTLNGFRSSPPKTLQDTASIYQISRERVRQIREAVEEKCRSSRVKIPHQVFFNLLLDDGNGSTLPINATKLQKLNNFTNGADPAHFIHIYDLISDAPGKITASQPVCGYAESIIGLPNQVEKASLLSEVVKSKIRVRRGARVYSLVPIGCASRIIGPEAIDIAKQIYPGAVIKPGTPVYADDEPKNVEGYIVVGRQDNRLLTVAKKIAGIVSEARLSKITEAYHRSLLGAGGSIKLPSESVVSTLMDDLDIGSFWRDQKTGNDPTFRFRIAPQESRVLSKTESALLNEMIDSSMDVESAAKNLITAGHVKRLVDKCRKYSPVPVFAKQAEITRKAEAKYRREQYNLAG